MLKIFGIKWDVPMYCPITRKEFYDKPYKIIIYYPQDPNINILSIFKTFMIKLDIKDYFYRFGKKGIICEFYNIILWKKTYKNLMKCENLCNIAIFGTNNDQKVSKCI